MSVTNSLAMRAPEIATELPVRRCLRGRSYVINSSCELVALWRSGIERWRYTTGTSNCRTTPAIGSDGTIYFVDGSGGVRAVNPDGTEKWNSAGLLAGRTSGQIAIGADGTLYASDNATLYAIE